MGGILDGLGEWIALAVFVIPIGTLWAVTLTGIALMSLRELWKGRRKRKRRRGKEL